MPLAVPADADGAQVAGAVIQWALCRWLRDRGVTGAELERELGKTRQTWNGLLRGDASFGLEHVAAVLARWPDAHEALPSSGGDVAPRWLVDALGGWEPGLPLRRVGSHPVDARMCAAAASWLESWLPSGRHLVSDATLVGHVLVPLMRGHDEASLLVDQQVSHGRANASLVLDARPRPIAVWATAMTDAARSDLVRRRAESARVAESVAAAAFADDVDARVVVVAPQQSLRDDAVVGGAATAREGEEWEVGPVPLPGEAAGAAAYEATAAVMARRRTRGWTAVAVRVGKGRVVGAT